MKKRKNLVLKVLLVVALVSVVASFNFGGSRQPAPAVSFRNLQGQTVKLSQYRGKVVLLNFWATWCDSCRSEIPELIEMQKQFGSRGFTVLGVAMDESSNATVQLYAEEPQFNVDGQKMAMNYPIVLGSEDASLKFGNIGSFPTSFVISRDGKIVREYFGSIEGQGVHQLIEKLL
jgi:peroxiredoxin